MRCERAIVVGDVNEFADAERVLEHLGDIDQLERLTVARKKASLQYMNGQSRRMISVFTFVWG